MDVYCNAKLDFVETYDIGKIYVNSHKATLIIDDKDNNIYKVYNHLHNLIGKYKEVALINCDSSDLSKKILYSLMIHNNQYNIYETIQDNIDAEYISYVDKNKGSLIDIKNFVNNPYTHDLRIQFMDKLQEYTKNKDYNSMFKLIQNSMENYNDSLDFIAFVNNFTMSTVENVNKAFKIINNGKVNIEKLQKELDTKNENISSLSVEIGIKEDIINQLNNTIDSSLADSNNEMSALVNKLNNHIAELEKKVVLVEEEKVQLQESIVALNNEIQKQSNIISTFGESKEEFDALNEKLHEYISANTELKQQVDKQRDAEDVFQRKIESLEANIEIKENEINVLKYTCNNLETEIDILNQNIKLFESSKEDSHNTIDYINQIEKLQEENENYKMMYSQLSEDVHKLNLLNESYADKLRNRAAGAMEFSALMLNNNSRIKSHNILYFKEINYVTYSNTLITKLHEAFIKRKYRAKLVIFDKADEFYAMYNGLTIVNGDYIRKKDDVLNSNKVVIMEPDMVILDDILTESYDVVIIVDRLKCLKDVVEGNRVTKFWIVNSRESIQALLNNASLKNKISSSNIITRQNVFNDTIGLAKIADYDNCTEQTKSAKWYGLINVNNTKDKFHIIPYIFERCGLQFRRR